MSISHEAALMALGLTDGDLELMIGCASEMVAFWRTEMGKGREAMPNFLAAKQAWQRYSELLDKLENL